MGKPSWYVQPRYDDTDAAWRAWQSLLTLLAAVVAASGGEAWVVGGILRDTLGITVRMAFASRPPGARQWPIITIVWRDVDVAVTGDPLALARAFAADLHAKSGDSQGVAIAPLRAKTVRLSIGPPILPFQAQLDLSRLDGATIEADLAQRDFRVNALALSLAAFLPTQSSPPAQSSPQTSGSPTMPNAGAAGSSTASAAPPSPDAQSGANDANMPNTALPGPSTTTSSWRAESALSGFARQFPSSTIDLIDPFGGVDDVRFGRLNVVGPRSLIDDPGRILRGARLLVAAALAPTEETTRLAREAAPLLLTLPADRVRDELRAIMAQSRPHGSLGFLAAVGAFQTLLPALWASLTDDPPGEAPGGAWWLALSSMAHASSLRVFGVQVNSDTGRLIGAEAQLLDGWYAQPLADGAPRSLALRWGLLLAAPIWRDLAPAAPAAAVTTQPPAPPAEPPATAPTSASMETLPAPRAARLAKLARTLPITREQRRIAETIALATPAAYALLALLALLATRDDVATLDAIETRRYFAAYGVVGVDALTAALCLVRGHWWEDGAPPIAHITLDEQTITRMGERALRLSAVYLTTPERIVPAPLLDGATVVRELGVAPGPLVGATLAAIRRAQIERQVVSQADALAWGAAYLRQRDNRTPDDTQVRGDQP